MRSLKNSYEYKTIDKAGWSILLCAFLVLLFPPMLIAEKSEAKEKETKKSICTIADEALTKAEEIRGLKRKEPVPCLLHNKKQVKNYLLDVINTKVPKEKLEAEEFVYKILGFIPEDFSYKEGILDLYLSQLGGYYDPEKNHFVMAAWIPEYLQNTVAVHELTHALQDQYFNLDNFLDHEDRTSDELLARSAVVEGDATAVMLDYTRSLLGQGSIAEIDNVQSVMLQNVLGASIASANAGVPESLGLLVIFPYTSGLRFAHHLLREGKGYKIFDGALTTHPKTTEEILHPELYLEKKVDYKEIDDARLRHNLLTDDWEMTYSDRLGEFMISILVGVQSKDRPKAALAAAGWGGDKVGIFTNKKTGAKHLSWVTEWDSAKDTEEFYDAMTTLLRGRFKVSEGDRAWKSDHMSYRLVREKQSVTLYADETTVK